MSARHQATERPGYPGKILVSALLTALAALIVVALLAWRGVHELGHLSERRSALTSHGESAVELRRVIQDLVLHARTFAITGDARWLEATFEADHAARGAFKEFRTTGDSVGAPDHTAFFAPNLDTSSARLTRIRLAGPEAAAMAREMARTTDGPDLVQVALALLDSSRTFVEQQEAGVATRIGTVERRLTLWIPLLAGLALGLGVLAVLLLRTQAIARAEDLTRFRAIFDNTFQFIGLLSRDGLVLESNRKSLEVAGISEDDVIGKPFWTTPWWGADSGAEARVREAVTRAAQGEFVRLPVEIRAKDSRHITIDFSITPVRGADGEISLLVPEGRDISDQLATEQALAEAEERWDFALVGSDLGVWDWDAERDRVFYSDRWKSILGFAPNEIGDSFREWADRVHPDDIDATMRSLNEHLEGRTPFFASIHRQRTKDGSYREILGRGMVVSRSPNGRPLRVIGTQQDVTDHRRAEAEARHLQEQLTDLLRNSPSLIAVFDADGRYLRASDSIAALLGKPVCQVVGHTVYELFAHEFAEAIRARISKVRMTGRMLEVEDDFDVSGSMRHFRTVLFPMRDASGTVTAVGSVAIDMTETHRTRTRLEAALDENRVLQGLLSICAQCKRIRDTEDDAWKPVESFVQSHSAAVFSHGLCPSCADAFMRENGLEDAG